jgi:OmpA-OmpF porin, OOP family
MKKVFIFVLTIAFSTAFGQITNNPKVDKRSAKYTKIDKVSLTNDYTIVEAHYYQPTIDEEVNRIIKENYPDISAADRETAYSYYYNQVKSSTPTISINPKSYLTEKGGRKYGYVKSTGLPELPDELNAKRGKTYNYTIYFKRVEKGIELIDMIEGKNSTFDTRSYWNYYGIHIINPDGTKPIETPAQIAPEKVVLTIRGKVLDAKTNKPIAGKIVCLNDKNQKIDSLNTPTSGAYLFELSPNVYTYSVSAEGYELLEEELDLSKLTKTQQFPKNFTLNPIKKEEKQEVIIETPKIEIPTPKTEEPSPIKIEENKFRLDKVFFPLGESNLLTESSAQLDGLVKMMKENPTMTIRVEGHTDNVGDPDQNRRLSLDRAFNVREYLVKKGIAGTRIQFKGLGELYPISTNDTEEGRQQNRRVEFVIVNQ